jgi:uncharacterized protein YndB with AHSA1/START domain
MNKENFSLTRKFNAPKQLVFQAFTSADALAKWWGPAGTTITVLKLEFKPNGIFHYKTEGMGKTMYGIFRYIKIVEPDMIEWINSFSNERAEVCPAPFDIKFPNEILNHLTLEEENGVTTLQLTGHPVNASPEEEKSYYSLFESMQKGFGGTFNQLEEYLDQFKNNQYEKV